MNTKIIASGLAVALALIGFYWIARAGSLEPPGPPGSTMLSLDSITTTCSNLVYECYTSQVTYACPPGTELLGARLLNNTNTNLHYPMRVTANPPTWSTGSVSYNCNAASAYMEITCCK